MKKVVLMLMFMIGAAVTFTSCKKDEEKTEKEKNLELLVSGKWYYQSYKTNGSNNTAYTCFTSANYWEFKSDGTFNETWDFGDGTYTISEDGKTLSLTTGNYTNTFTITSISNSELKMNLAGSKFSADFSMAKTALNCTAR